MDGTNSKPSAEELDKLRRTWKPSNSHLRYD